MFYILMIIELIVIGISFFLWFQWNREEKGTSYSTVTSSRNVDPPFEETYSEPKRERAPKPGKNSTKKKSKKKTKQSELEEDIAWNSFGIVERDKSLVADRREMDDLIGVGNQSDDDYLTVQDLQNSKEQNSNGKNKTIEDEFAELFSDDEKEQFDNSFEFKNPPKPKQEEPSFEDFSDFENFNIGNEVEDTSKTTQDENDDAYDFLKNYDFGKEDNDNLDDDIFERARNKTLNSEQPKTTNVTTENFDDWDEEPTSKIAPTRETENKKTSPAKQSNFPIDEDDDDDIFARLQRLSNMMDQQKK
ncbi:hypothetical protein ACFC4S_22110 [Priestia megaterium]|uniref:hypothetical protein n=1 Tax=Priestia megaterium TaxID=1404 RepID=UPI0035D5B6DE